MPHLSKKAERKTFGLDKFWNGSHSRSEKGLETSIISIVDREQNASLALSAAQTPPHLATTERHPAKPTRIDFYLRHFLATLAYFPATIEYLLVDGFYAKFKFVDGVCRHAVHLISRLRRDAHLKYLYSGEQKPRGAKRKFDGKVVFTDLSRFEKQVVKVGNQSVELFSAKLWSVSLKRPVKLVLVKYKKHSVNLLRDQCSAISRGYSRILPKPLHD